MTHVSRMLLEHLIAMERSAKQFLILEDPTFLDSYLHNRESFVAAIKELFAAVERQPEMEQNLRSLEGYEFDLYTLLLEPGLDNQTKLAAATQFGFLRELADRVWYLSIELVGRNLEQLELRSKNARQQALRNLTILMPVAVLLLIFFIYLIIRPIRQLEAAIRRLGDRHFDEPIEVQGPKDLEVLGQALDWLRTRLRMLEAEKQRFMRNISHELKTPLANIYEGVELLHDRVVGELNTEQNEIVRIISTNASRLYQMIEDLIRYSQMQQIEENLHPQVINMALLVEEVIEEYAVRLRINNILILSQLKPVEILGFPVFLRTMVDNLVSNAVKYSPPNSEIRIKLYRRQGVLFFEILDQGPGIPGGERKRVFDALYQGSTGRKLGIEGTGLGLAIVNECVIMHRGQVEILDPPDEKGAYFRVSIPLNSVVN
ncbi:MAG TPA: HAMP domain-containing histidine kinase [Armatimonadetes bacterium]|nr:HAMP domain-containing histidine kinase [Armatimonadota bacterium]